MAAMKMQDVSILWVVLSVSASQDIQAVAYFAVRRHSSDLLQQLM